MSANHYFGEMNPMGGKSFDFDDFAWAKEVAPSFDTPKEVTTADFIANAPETPTTTAVMNTPWHKRLKTAFDANNNPNYLNANNELVEGIYIGVPNELYHALPALSSSMLKTFAVSPAHYYRNYLSDVDRKRTVTQERTLDTGSLSHELVLEPHGFYDRFASALDPLVHENALKTGDDLSKKCVELGLKKTGKKDELIKRLIDHDPKLKKDIWDCIVSEHQEMNDGKEVVDHIVWNDALRSANTTLSNAVAKNLFSKGMPELTIISYCPVTKIWMKCRPDWLRYDLIVVDYKTTRDSSPKGFAKQSKELNYPIQQEFYKHVMSLQGIHASEFIFVATEYLSADICQVYDLDPGWTEEAQIQTISLIEELADCINNNDWYGYDKTPEIQTLKQPWRNKTRNSSLLAKSSGAIVTAINSSLNINPFDNI